MMSLGAILELTGRLTDQSGSNTARERFRRFLRSDVPGLAGVRALIAEAHESDDEQALRALGDLVVTLGRFVGCDVTYGTYARTSYGARVTGTWSSPDLRIAIDVCVLREGAAPPAQQEAGRDEFANVVPMIGRPAQLRIVVPRNHVTTADETTDDATSGSPAVALESVIALADEVEHGRLTCAAALDVLLHPESPPELEEPSQGDVASADDSQSTSPAIGSDATGEAAVESGSATEFWIATIVEDEGAPAELLIDKVIGERRVLPASRLGMFMPSARPGDWVCFFVAGSGVVGWAQLQSRLDPLSAPVRRAHRFASIFALTSVSFHAQPVALDSTSLPQRLAVRSPLGVAGSFLSPISEQDFRALTAGSLPLTVES